MTVPAISWALGFEAVHVGHLGGGHARRGRQAAERVARAHLVGAHRLGRALRRGGGRGLATGALPGAGSLSVVPEMTHESGLSPLAAASELRPMPWRAAMALSESPGCTR